MTKPLLFTLLAFGAVASDNIQIGNTANVHKNAPWVIAQPTLFFLQSETCAG